VKELTEETVTITKAEYEALLDRVNFLDCLEGCGVDNWQGYGDAYEMYESEEE
jgi:hypothetical protein